MFPHYKIEFKVLFCFFPSAVWEASPWISLPSKACLPDSLPPRWVQLTRYSSPRAGRGGLTGGSNSSCACGDNSKLLSPTSLGKKSFDWSSAGKGLLILDPSKPLPPVEAGLLLQARRQQGVDVAGCQGLCAGGWQQQTAHCLAHVS